MTTSAASASSARSWAQIAATTLENDFVRLEPIAPEHRSAERAIALDPEIWRYFVIMVETPEDFDAFFDAGLADLAAGVRVPYHITDKRSGHAAGSMSFGNLAQRDGRLEIGWSWLGTGFQGKDVNRWAKFLMLEHAFERMGVERVEFKTDALNTRARRALSRIGATEEGTLRSFNPMPYGSRRNAVYYSVLKEEWPAARKQLLALDGDAPGAAS